MMIMSHDHCDILSMLMTIKIILLSAPVTYLCIDNDNTPGLQTCVMIISHDHCDILLLMLMTIKIILSAPVTCPSIEI